MPVRQALAQTAAADPRQLQSHSGLWIDKMLASEEPSSEVAGPHLRRIVQPPIPAGYDKAFALRKRDIESAADDGHCSFFEAKTKGRMVVGLGCKGVLEMGIQLDHTWGVPYLPGSALKGLAAAAAHRLSGDPDWQKSRGWPEAAAPPEGWTDHQVLFGTTSNQGAVCFDDAWWNPEGERAVPLEMDVMTVHHPDYYQRGGTPPSDFDAPVPVPFLSSRGSFLVTLEGPSAWRRAAAFWLRVGLEELGLGAKTSSGYGRFELTELDTPRQRQRVERQQVLRRVLSRYQPGQKQEAARAIAAAVEVGVGWDEIKAALSPLDRGQRTALLDALRSSLPTARLDELLAPPARTMSPAPEAPPKPAALAPAWVERAAWAVRDAKNRIQLMVEDMPAVDVGKLADKPSDALKAALLAASRESPVRVEVRLDGQKLKGVREPR